MTFSKHRIYHPETLTKNSVTYLSKEAAHHLLTVLRLKVSAPIILFDGQNNEANAIIESADRKQASVKIHEVAKISRESERRIHLAQSLGKGDKMDWIIQKAAELGVHAFTPLISDRTVVKLDAKRLDKKVSAWQKIIISASEQCGRNQLMKLNPFQSFSDFIQNESSTMLFLHPNAEKLSTISQHQASESTTTLLIGPEGGFSEKEVLSVEKLATPVSLGARVLRMETAALAAATLLIYS